MLDAQVIAFCGVALALAVTPGPDMALVLRNSLRGGRPAAFRTIAGVSVGLVGWGLASAFGVAAILAASSTVFTMLKVAGGVYLVYLGIQTLRALKRNARVERSIGRTSGSPFRQGLVTNLPTRSWPSSSRRSCRSSSRPVTRTSPKRCSWPCSSC